jgi:hypothetical protein
LSGATIKVHRAKLTELNELQTSIKQAEARLAAMETEIDETAGVENEIAEAAATTLQLGKDVSDRSKAWRAKEERDALIADHESLSTGLLRLQARALAAEREVAAELVEVHRIREPIIQHSSISWASELVLKESEASALRNRLRGFSMSAAGPVPQKLSNFARSLLVSPPRNSVPPQRNSPEQRTVDREREIFREWRKALESDAQAQLSL